MLGSGMMPAPYSQILLDPEPLAITDAKSAVRNYLRLFDEDLEIQEIIIFSNPWLCTGY